MQLAPLSYSLVIMLKNKIYAVRDPYGNRPLCLGKILPFNERRYTFHLHHVDNDFFKYIICVLQYNILILLFVIFIY